MFGVNASLVRVKDFLDMPAKHLSIGKRPFIYI
jgi:hypothetical protein